MPLSSNSQEKESILYVITTLDRGGAETMLTRLLERLDRDRFEPAVVCLGSRGPLADEIEKLDIPVTCLGLNPRLPRPDALWNFFREVRVRDPDIIHTWMYHADLVGGILGRLATDTSVIWSLRQSNFDSGKTSYSTLIVVQICVWLSAFVPEKIISCSQTGKQVHVDWGYPEDIIEVIPNGFDTEEFQPDESQRVALRERLGLDEDQFLIGLVARFHPQKDHETFIRAAGLLHRDFPEAHFLLCGQGTTDENSTLTSWIRDEGIEDCVHLLGEREDVLPVYSALDLATSSSAYGEGFPNVLGEAMACEVPCVTTDVGDARELVDDTGLVVEPENPKQLAEAWEEFVTMNDARLRKGGRRARNRIQDHFEIGRIAQQFERCYENFL